MDIFINDRTTADDVFISTQLAFTSERLCNLWISTRDKIQRKLNSPSNHRYGLQFKNLHLLLCILLVGDIATNPGPTNMNYSKARNPDSTTSPDHYLQSQNNNFSHNRKPFAKFLVVNARSLLSFHKKDGRQSCHLSNFQDLVYSEEADLVWVTETWLKDDVESSEILPWGYTIYRKGRKSRAGGVLLAIKSSSFTASCEVNFGTDLELVTVELTSKSNLKYLVCCCYKSLQNVGSQWINEFSLFLSKSCSRYSNIIICGDFNFPKISWDSPELTTGVDEVQFTDQLNDFHLTQLDSSSTRGDHVLDLVITNVPTSNTRREYLGTQPN